MTNNTHTPGPWTPRPMTKRSQTMKLPTVDCSQGAPMGRANTLEGLDPPGKVHLRRAYLDSGGYDDGGAYWGIGEPLWWALCPTTNAERFIRAPSRTQAKRIIQQMWTNATFFDGGVDK